MDSPRSRNGSPAPSFKDSLLDSEPRKRAPRALTGRYVRTGTAASPAVLQVLRKKIEERVKLKELLEDHHTSHHSSSKLSAAGLGSMQHPTSLHPPVNPYFASFSKHAMPSFNHARPNF